MSYNSTKIGITFETFSGTESDDYNVAASGTASRAFRSSARNDKCVEKLEMQKSEIGRFP